MKWFLIAGIVLFVLYGFMRLWIKSNTELLAKAVFKISNAPMIVCGLSIILSVICFAVSLIWFIIDKV